MLPKRGCVIGAGPAGIALGKLLQQNGFVVTLFEKSNKINGNYNYSKDLKDKIKVNDTGLNIKFNKTQKDAKNSLCDFFCLAVGGKERKLSFPGCEYLVSGFKMIKRYFKDSSIDPGSNTCIIGMGNMAMDLISYIGTSGTNLTVLSRSPLKDAAFDNHKMREIVDSGVFNIQVCDIFGNAEDRKTSRRYSMLQPFVERKKNNNPNLNLIFDTEIQKIIKEPAGLVLRYKNKGIQSYGIFDKIISCAGFEPREVNIKTDKPVFKIGWCKDGRGSVDKLFRESQGVMEDIKEHFSK